jgi:hypothetical protein
MEQWQIDILNIAQQQQAQKCVDAAYPATFTGAVTTPTTVSYPAGVANATYISTSKSAASVTVSGFGFMDARMQGCKS